MLHIPLLLTSRRLLMAALLCLAPIPALAQSTDDLPLAGVPDIANGEATLFDGNWSIVRPGGSNSLLTCHLPTTLEGGDGNTLVYRDIGGRSTTFTVSAGDGQTHWEGEERQTAVWTGPDSFILYPHLRNGALALDEAMLYERCEIWPRESYPGVPEGTAAPFAGRWSEAMPAERGAGRPAVVGFSCDNPTTYVVIDHRTLRLSAGDGTVQTIPIEIRDGATFFPNNGYPAAVIWVSPDRWHLHLAGMDRRPDWNLPIILERCPAT